MSTKRRLLLTRLWTNHHVEAAFMASVMLFEKEMLLLKEPYQVNGISNTTRKHFADYNVGTPSLNQYASRQPCLIQEGGFVSLLLARFDIFHRSLCVFFLKR